MGSTCKIFLRKGQCQNEWALDVYKQKVTFDVKLAHKNNVHETLREQFILL